MSERILPPVPLEKLKLLKRTERALRRHGMTDVTELAKIPARELLMINDIGQDGVFDIIEALREWRTEMTQPLADDPGLTGLRLDLILQQLRELNTNLDKIATVLDMRLKR